MEKRFKIKGLDCAYCAAELERKLGKIKGINKASISFMMEILEIEYDGESEKDIIEKMIKISRKEEPTILIEEL